ncbi:hypothetical protein ACFLY4_09665, partial [Chloroflexota bacterium]
MHRKVLKQSVYLIIATWVVLVAGCSTVAPAVTQSPTTSPINIATPSSIIVPTRTSTQQPTETATLTMTSTATKTLTPTQTATITQTPTITLTVPPPEGFVNVAQANCRYGPGAAYLYKFGLYQGISVEILGRTDRGDWVYVLPLWYEDGCWIKADLLQVSGDIFSVEVDYGTLPFSDIYPPTWITDVRRDGDEVFLAWSDVRMTVDKYRGYLIEAWLCVNGELVFTPLNIDGLVLVLTDEAGCSEP